MSLKERNYFMHSGGFFLNIDYAVVIKSGEQVVASKEEFYKTESNKYPRLHK
jgi:hypothetical protein